MKQYSNLLLLILIVGLVLYSYEKKNNSKPENNKDKIARFDITSMKKLIQEKKQRIYRSLHNRQKR